MRTAAAVTADLEIEAYKHGRSRKTRDSDLARYLKKRMAELGYEDGWAPDQNPNVNSGPDRGHSHATDKVIQPGDFIQTDFGIKVHGRWVTDIQRFAYVLAPGETAAPKSALEKWEKGKRGSRVALAAMKPGARGYDVDKAQRDWMKEAGSLPMPWGTGHPVGYWAHDPGPGALRRAERSAAEPARSPQARSGTDLRVRRILLLGARSSGEDDQEHLRRGDGGRDGERGGIPHSAPGRADSHSVRQMRRTMEPCGRPPRRWPSGSSRASRARGRSTGATSSTTPRS